ncbi:MAG: adenylyltransferase/cytidyltransferase family protein [Dehalococcoidia bacterium]
MSFQYGMVHGRFQPFHNDHLDYLKKALARSQHLIIGITNPDPSEIREETTSEHRHLEDSNPFTFFQRMSMIRAALVQEGIGLDRFSFVPFPIHHPDKWPYYLPDPQSVMLYIRVYSDWEQTKVDRFRSRGWRVEVLDPGSTKGITATEVRQRLLSGGDWEELVPEAVARIIKEVCP